MTRRRRSCRQGVRPSGARTAGRCLASPAAWWSSFADYNRALLASGLGLATLTRLLAICAVGTNALVGGGWTAAAGKLARASVAAAAPLSHGD